MMDMTWLRAILVGAGCLALGYLFGTKYPGVIKFKAKSATNTAVINGKKTRAKPPLEVEKLAEILEDFKMVLTCSLHTSKYFPHALSDLDLRIICFSYAGFSCEE